MGVGSGRGEGRPVHWQGQHLRDRARGEEEDLLGSCGVPRAQEEQLPEKGLYLGFVSLDGDELHICFP